MARPRQERREPEISWTHAVRIEPGQYRAYSRTAAAYFDHQFKRWVCAVQFDILDDSLLKVIEKLTWYLNLGSKEKPHASRRGLFWGAWVRANGGPPQRRHRMTPRVFERRFALIEVADTAKAHNSGSIDPSLRYSVVRSVIRWETGGVPDQPSFSNQLIQSNHTSRQARDM